MKAKLPAAKAPLPKFRSDTTPTSHKSPVPCGEGVHTCRDGRAELASAAKSSSAAGTVPAPRGPMRNLVFDLTAGLHANLNARLPASKFPFEIQAECPVTRARAGLLHTPHGPVETPIFMPVGTQATVKGLAPRELAGELDVRILLANTYHLYLRPGADLIRAMGGLHRFMSWPRAILTDSGGFQVFSLRGLRKITEEGVVFQSHLNGDTHRFTPASTVETQLAFGSDILMVLDECPEYPVSHEYARTAMQRTARWARTGHA
jgi:hypothetical protein